MVVNYVNVSIIIIDLKIGKYYLMYASKRLLHNMLISICIMFEIYVSSKHSPSHNLVPVLKWNAAAHPSESHLPASLHLPQCGAQVPATECHIHFVHDNYMLPNINKFTDALMR